MRAARTEKTQFLQRYQIGVNYLERYNRRIESGDDTEAGKVRANNFKREMEQIEAVICTVNNDGYRDLLTRRYIYGENSRSIAAAIGSTPENVQRRLYNAIKKLELPKEG